MLAAVQPRNSEWELGAKNVAGTPTSVTGAFSGVGAQGFPKPGVPGIAAARNNSGSNVRIPYARLVPLRAPSQKANYGGMSAKNEYDGLETGEVAWIRGRTKDADTQSAGGGFGFGVDRMQRLADTGYVESYFSMQFANTEISATGTNLHTKEPGPFLRLRTGNLANTEDATYLNAYKTFNDALKDKGLFSWTPDGLVLSKLESPAGDALSSQQLDARQAQLFNVAVQGPALAKSWTGNPLLASMPMDRVFVVIVADYIEDSLDNYKKAVKAYTKAVKALKSSTGDNMSTLYSNVDAALLNINNSFSGALVTNDDKKNSASLTPDYIQDANAILTNFRLRRVTSSYLSLYSSGTGNGKDADTKKRCGLKRGGKNAEYIIGGWCIGSVLDSAASRSTVGSLVRTAPASMALNINVCVEWWSGDQLYRSYMDNNVLARGVKRKST
jgi:hypothetical protein